MTLTGVLNIWVTWSTFQTEKLPVGGAHPQEIPRDPERREAPTPGRIVLLDAQVQHLRRGRLLGRRLLPLPLGRGGGLHPQGGWQFARTMIHSRVP